MELPVSYEKKMQELLKNEFQAYEKCLETPVFRGRRVHTGKIGAEEVEDFSVSLWKNLLDSKRILHSGGGEGLPPSLLWGGAFLPPGAKRHDACKDAARKARG